MKQNLLFIVLLLLCIKLFSQESKFSLELNYPIPIDNNFVSENYNGIIDVGLKYRFSNIDFLNIGASINASIFIDSYHDVPFAVNIHTIQPRIFSELDLESLSKFHPAIALGYTFITSNAGGDENINPFANGSGKNGGGYNLNLALVYDLTNRLFAQIQYDFIKIGVDNEVPDIKYNTNINVLKLGLGYRF